MRLYRFRYSPFARKVQMVLDLLGKHYEVIEVPYGDRTELATLTGGYIHVPVLLDENGGVTIESRAICEKLLAEPGAEFLAPAPFEGPIWAYADFCDGPLEDVLFRIASPSVRENWPSVSDRALYVLIKERKFGPGCVDTWLRERDDLINRAQRLLAPSMTTLQRQPFLFGASPTLADAALYGDCAMLQEADRGLLPRVGLGLDHFMQRMEAFAADVRSKSA